MEKIIEKYKKELDLVYQGELFGETVACEMCKEIITTTKEYDILLFKEFEMAFMDMLNTKNIRDFIKETEKIESLVEYYGFLDNEIGIYLLEYMIYKLV